MENQRCIEEAMFKKNAPSLKNSKGVSFLLKARNILNNCRDRLNIQQNLKKNQKDEKRKKKNKINK